MKNLITFLLYCLSVTALLAQAKSESSLELLSSSPTETTVQLKLSGIDQTNVQTPNGAASIIHIKDGTPLLKKGTPDVPKYSTVLLIPNKGNMEVEILSGEYDEYTDIEVAPSKGNLLRTVNPDEVPFEFGQEYTRDQFFPGPLANLQDPFIMRNARGQALWIYPVQYNPVKKVLRVYRSLTLRIHSVGGTGKNELSGGPISAPSQTFSQIYQQLFVNAQLRAGDRNANPEPDKMLVIANDDLLDELQPLVNWKRQMGIHTTVVPVSEIGSSNSTVIYNFVKDYYAEHGISYLLLAGDEHAIEPEMRSNGGSYSCDNCFGYMSGDDHFPEVLVGRLHAESPDQMRIMVNRNLEYETNPLIDSTQNWMATGMASASNEGAGIGDDDQADWEHGNEWKAKHLDDGFEQYWEFYDGNHSADSPTPSDTTADQAGNPTNAPLVSLMNSRGVSLYNYTGHGWEQGLVSGNFTTTAVGNLRNTGRYPILISVACCAGNFTNGDCLGEVFQRAGNTATGEPWGGIAGFFSSDYQSWSPPMEGQDGMNQYLVDADGINIRPNISGMLAFGNARMIAAYGLGGELMADFWNPFAEPTTVPRTAMPQVLIASHIDSTAFETTSLMVACPVEGALVSLFWDDQTRAVAIVENGIATLEFLPFNNIGKATITVTQFNHIPYQGTVVIKPAGQPFVVNQQIDLDDSTGNANQQADFDESVTMNVLLKNIGIGTATAVQATVETNNPYVTLTNTQVSLGDLDSSAETLAAFDFTVSDDVPNGTKAEFTLNIDHSDSLHFTTSVVVTLYAPALEVGGWSINDLANGNGNGRLETGEIAELRIANYNIGASNSPDAIGTLVSSTSYLSVSDAVALGPLDALTGAQEALFYLTVAPDAPASYTFDLNYAVAAGKYDASGTIGPLVLNAIVETFETNDFSSFNWQQAGNKPWTVTTSGSYAGQRCARSGMITHNQESTLQLTLLVMEEGLVSFARKVSSEADFDYLRFYIDGFEQDAWSGEVPWSEVSFPVSVGQHTLTWKYIKDDLVSSGWDRAWVDEIMLPSHQIVVGTNTPIQEGLASLSVSPNPTSGMLNIQIELSQEQVLGVQIIDYLGRLIQTVQRPMQTRAGSIQFTADMQAVPPGVYFVQVQGAQINKAVKLVVTK